VWAWNLGQGDCEKQDFADIALLLQHINEGVCFYADN
jgi:hypothetical protein